MLKKSASVLVAISVWLLIVFLHRALAVSQTDSHFTIFINQVRGEECCGKGSLATFRAQLEYFTKKNLTAHFALRWDVVLDSNYQAVIAQNTAHYGGLLEITPALAKAAGVEYHGTETTWYEASNVFLIGYTVDERKKLLDTYFITFFETFGYYPEFTVAWMIDPWSLHYMYTTYGVQVHEITREQFGTDSYTLYGGPVHYPYYPSSNWALVPSERNNSMPLIVRQTISDPVLNYGDRSNSYTSQPNDYLLRQANFDYFKHLFYQTHQQDHPYTIGILGLENSMTNDVNQEFLKQVDEVDAWRNSGQGAVISLKELNERHQQFDHGGFTIYAGVSFSNQNEKAWWIQNNAYRLRLRLSNGELFISDIRVYDSTFNDPYITKEVSASGWWIAPYVLDGSRHFSDQSSSVANNDILVNRHELLGDPHRFSLGSVKDVELKRQAEGTQVVVEADGKAIMQLNPRSLKFVSVPEELNAYQETIKNLSFVDAKGNELWGFKQHDASGEWLMYVNESDLDATRDAFKEWLQPEVSFGKADPHYTSTLVNNQYAVAGRNPVRLVFFPKDDQGNSVKLSKLPEVRVDNAIVSAQLYEPHSSNGMIFIDFESDVSLKTDVVVRSDEYETKQTIFFVPNCKQRVFYCVVHPRRAVWYVKSVIADRKRAKDEKLQNELKISN